MAELHFDHCKRNPSQTTCPHVPIVEVALELGTRKSVVLISILHHLFGVQFLLVLGFALHAAIYGNWHTAIVSELRPVEWKTNSESAPPKQN